MSNNFSYVRIDLEKVQAGNYIFGYSLLLLPRRQFLTYTYANMEVKALDVTKKQKDKKSYNSSEREEIEQENIGLSLSQLKAKIVLDIAILLCSSPIILPLGVITAIIIKLESKGPVFFKQQRVGKDGELFTMYKFRSMKANSDESGCKFASKDDDRITTFGKFIRKFRIDEIPQFLNVLKGEMSVIGPRPEQEAFVELFNGEIEKYDLRHSVKPGITGLAQVKQGYAASEQGTKRKLTYDLFYIKKYSLQLDFLIVGKTIHTVLTGFGAR